MKLGTQTYARVTKDMPCPICGKPDWCLISIDKVVAICSRVSEGSIKSVKSGHIHKLQENQKPKCHIKPPSKKIIDHKAMALAYERLDTSQVGLRKMAKYLSVKVAILQSMHAGYDEYRNYWVFPMFNEQFEIIGLKCRNLSGNKWCIDGSRLGVYVGASYNPNQPLMIVEGESDTATVLNQGFNVLGRPSATACFDLIVRMVVAPEVYLFADTDSGIGLSSTLDLAKRINCSKVIHHKWYKDPREWIAGGDFTLDEIKHWEYQA